MRRPVRRAWAALGLVAATAGLAVGGTLLTVDTASSRSWWISVLVSAPFVLAGAVVLFVAGYTTAGYWSRAFVLFGLMALVALIALALYLGTEKIGRASCRERVYV